MSKKQIKHGGLMILLVFTPTALTSFRYHLSYLSSVGRWTCDLCSSGRWFSGHLCLSCAAGRAKGPTGSWRSKFGVERQSVYSSLGCSLPASHGGYRDKGSESLREIYIHRQAPVMWCITHSNDFSPLNNNSICSKNLFTGTDGGLIVLYNWHYDHKPTSLSFWNEARVFTTINRNHRQIKQAFDKMITDADSEV